MNGRKLLEQRPTSGALMRRLFHVMGFLSVVSLTAARSQPLQLDSRVFADRRQSFMEKMDPAAIAILPSKPTYVRNRDIDYEYRQESNFYYLTGFEEPDAIVLLAPSNPRYRFVMFVRNRDSRLESFEGPRAGVAGAMDVFHADTALYYDDFEISVYQFIRREGMLYYPFGINPEIDEKIQKRFSSDFWRISNPYPVLAEMRLIKNEGDWKLGLRQAIDISAKGHCEAIRNIRPGMYEYEVQADFEHVFRGNGSPRDAYPCIVGSGPNSCILHYSKNFRKMASGEMVLMDCAAEYGYYAADITRTVPVNGTFTKEQKTIYEMVLDAQKAGMQIVRPGIELRAVSAVIDSVFGSRLMSLGFIKDKNDFRLFTLHGYSHWIGLDVHDVGEYTKNGGPRLLEPGMVFTIEPGIYVKADVFDRLKEKGYSDYEVRMLHPVIDPFLNIGVRIEDDVVVTESGYTNLSAAAPREISELEALMRH